MLCSGRKALQLRSSSGLDCRVCTYNAHSHVIHNLQSYREGGGPCNDYEVFVLVDVEKSLGSGYGS